MSRSACRGRAPRILAALFVLAGSVLVPGEALAARIAPDRAPAPVWIEINGKPYGYFSLTAGEPLSFTIEGPAVFEPVLRWRFEGDGAGGNVDVGLSLDGRKLAHRVFRPEKARWTYFDRPEAVPGRAVRIAVEIPEGTHTVEMALHAPGEGTLDVNPVLKPPYVLPYRLEWRAEAGAAYDSNIFRYGDADVDDFLDGVGADTYQAEYLDDLRVEPSLDLSLVRERPGKSLTELRLSVDARLATVNTEKSFMKVGGRLRESHDGLGYGSLSYYVIPSYQVRELWDADAPSGDRYRSCEFRKSSVRAEIGTDDILPIDLVGHVQYDDWGYNQDFVEYDSHAWTQSFRGIWRPVRGVRIDLGYALRRLEARGYDELVEEGGISDDSDISYEQDAYTLKLRWDIGRVMSYRTALTLRARVANRYYRTEKSIEDDPYHSGREDTYWTFSARSSHRITEGTTFELFAEHRRRASESAYFDDAGIDKDYTAYRVGIRLIFEGERILD